MELMPPMENQFIEEIETPVSNQSDLLEVVEEAEALKDQTEENIEQTPELVTEEEVVEDDKEDERVEPETLEEKKEEVRHMNEVDELPIFPGGNAQLVKWLSSNLKYPESAKNEKVGGKVVVEFVVNANGTVSDIQLNKKVDDRLDGEALRVVRMMPNWKAGILGGRPCRTLVRLPIVFKL
jgi:protein TonB